jgi:hypothetical protein
MYVATQSQVETELNTRNYFLETAPADNTIPNGDKDTASFFEKNAKTLMLIFAGAFLLAIFPGQSEGGQSV